LIRRTGLPKRVKDRLPALVKPRQRVGFEAYIVDVHVSVQLMSMVDLEDVDLARQYFF